MRRCSVYSIAVVGIAGEEKFAASVDLALSGLRGFERYYELQGRVGLFGGDGGDLPYALCLIFTQFSTARDREIARVGGLGPIQFSARPWLKRLSS